MPYKESQFIHHISPQLHTSSEVETTLAYLRQNGERIPNSPSEKIASHIGFLASKEFANDGILTGDVESVSRQVEANIVKPENVPESYFDLQKKIARERGHGDIEIGEDERMKMVDAIRQDQRVSLHRWADYLSGGDAGYPDWFKYYVFEGVKKLGDFDKAKGTFKKRSKSTTSNFVELNYEALAYVYDAVNFEYFSGPKPEDPEVANDQKLKELLKAPNFGRLYAHAVLEATPANRELLQNIDGSWVKFNQIEGEFEPLYDTDDNGEYVDDIEDASIDDEALRLARSLQGHGTGWCTAGEVTAADQLSMGDFYVYYTKDQDGNDTIPRIAVRMEHGQVAELRGINADQELEPELIDVAMERVLSLPGGEKYQKRANDMKWLTELDESIKNAPGVEIPLSDLKRLYGLGEPIEGFAQFNSLDPRVGEILAKRNRKDDLKKIFEGYKNDKSEVIAAIIEQNGVNRLLELEEDLPFVLTDEDRDSVIKELFSFETKYDEERGQYYYVSKHYIDSDFYGFRNKGWASALVRYNPSESIRLVRDGYVAKSIQDDLANMLLDSDDEDTLPIALDMLRTYAAHNIINVEFDKDKLTRKLIQFGASYKSLVDGFNPLPISRLEYRKLRKEFKRRGILKADFDEPSVLPLPTGRS